MKARKLDVLLVNPSAKRAYQKFQLNEAQFGETGLTAQEPPIWAGLLASYVLRKGFSVEILDTNVEDIQHEEAAQRIAEISPILAAFVIYGNNPSASTQTMVPAGEISRLLKQLASHQKVLLVGGHVAALPQRTLREEAGDFTCTGEGPVTIVELVQALKAGTDEFHKVRGLCYWDNHVATNKPAPLVLDLDNEMPGMAYDLLPMDKYVSHHWHCYGGIPRQPYAAMYTTLGCPWKCDFCCIQAPFRSGEQALGMTRKSWRYWSPEIVIGWIDYLFGRGVRNVKIADEMPNPRYLSQLCDLIIQRGYGDELNVWCYDRVDTANLQRYEKMRQAGIRWVALGIEAADAKVRQGVDKGKFGEDRICRAVDYAHRAGMYVIANYIFGLPEDNMASMQKTLELSLELGTEGLNYYCTMAFPGSALYEQTLREKPEVLPKSWIEYSQHNEHTRPLPTKHLPSEQVLAFRDYAYFAAQSNPGYLMIIREKFGEETAQYVKGISAQQFVRQHRDEKLYEELMTSLHSC